MARSSDDQREIFRGRLILAAMLMLTVILVGSGGYQVSWNREHPATAMATAHGWCKRYRALDVQQMEWIKIGIADTQ